MPHALAVGVQPSLDIVQRVAHNVQPAPKRLVEWPAVATDALLVRRDAKPGLIPLRAAAPFFCLADVSGRKRNWRLRFDRSIVSMSVTTTSPSPVPTPISARHLRSRSRSRRRRRRARQGARTAHRRAPPAGRRGGRRAARTRRRRAAAPAAHRQSRRSSWRSGVKRPVHALSASCAATPKKAASGESAPAAPRANASTASSSMASAGATPPPRTASRNAPALSAQPAVGSPAAPRASSAQKHACRQRSPRARAADVDDVGGGVGRHRGEHAKGEGRRLLHLYGRPPRACSPRPRVMRSVWRSTTRTAKARPARTAPPSRRRPRSARRRRPASHAAARAP